MQFEKVHTIRDIYDGVRTGTADLDGRPHYFSCHFDKEQGDYSEWFDLFPVSTEFMEHELEHWAIYQAWEAKFHRNLEPLSTHPGHGGIDPVYDQLGAWLKSQIEELEPLPARRKASFRALDGQEALPQGILRELEVAWFS